MLTKLLRLIEVFLGILFIATRNFPATVNGFLVRDSLPKLRRDLSSPQWTGSAPTCDANKRFFLFQATIPEQSNQISDSSESKGTGRGEGTSNNVNDNNSNGSPKFEFPTALFAAGLAFDAYVEPPSNSSRWEKGSQGLNVAFVSAAFARNLYKGLLQVTVEKCTGLPSEDEAGGAERLITGKGVDACVLVAAVEGSWKEDVRMLEKEQYHEGVLDLTGAAHVGRTKTAWASIDERQSQISKKQRGRASPYHIKAEWGRGAQAVWPEPEPFYLYIQDPASARLVFTIMDDNRIGSGMAIGSTHKRLSELIPQAGLSSNQLLTSLKKEWLEAAAAVDRKGGEMDAVLDDNWQIRLGAKSWRGELPLTSKPRKRDKNSQMLAAAAAGAYLAGPVGAAAGALLGSFYEGQVQGRIHLQLRYLPIAQVPVPRQTYDVKGGMPGIDWGSLLEDFCRKQGNPETVQRFGVGDLEHCFFINHDKTGATCSVYRSLERKLIVVSFRGTCAPVDLITDASLVQDAWVEGDDINEQDLPKVHAGFRTSLNSIARRLKELLLATVASGDELSDYDMLVTGHSLGGALATLFVADIGEYGVDAGRALPQLQESEPWWKSIANTFMGQEAQGSTQYKDPPRPKSLRLYNFGSPRVGNNAFADLFDALVAEGYIDQAYRIVNGEDAVARMPRTMNALVFGQVRYEHCGTTVLISQPLNDQGEALSDKGILWIEGESDDSRCPVRDGVALSSPMTEGSLLSDILNATRASLTNGEAAVAAEEMNLMNRLSNAVQQVTSRLKTVTATDVASLVGLDKDFTAREMKFIQSIFQGKALAHHMEDQYYGMCQQVAANMASSSLSTTRDEADYEREG